MNLNLTQTLNSNAQTTLKVKQFSFLALLLLSLLLPTQLLHAQQQQIFSRADTLRGSITPQRAWWDVTFYDLHVAIQPRDSVISGHNTIAYKMREAPEGRKMQIDLRRPLEIDSIKQKGEALAFSRQSDMAWFVDVKNQKKRGALDSLTVWYHGQPKIAEKPPWDGGFIWERDKNGRHWIATANQSIGASVWWPVKDHQSDEPDSVSINITVPESMKNISNGRLRSVTSNSDGTKTWSWFVSSPINVYNVAVNAGNYVHFSDTLNGESGVLDINYWVLDYALEKAKKQFVQVKPMLRCFEHWFGPYPFYEDGYKLIHTPYLGMEHQSAVGYGNGFQNGYMGRDLSGTGWGLTWDFIIVHESGHEWFGNNITTKDIADMWVHEGFTNYAENLFVQCLWGKQAGAEYVIGSRRNIQNERPMIARYGVHEEGPIDIYYKGANLLHMIRALIDDDEIWRTMLRAMNAKFHNQTVSSAQIEQFISDRSGIDLSAVFDQYLRHPTLPVLEYDIQNGQLYYRWNADVQSFGMPVDVWLGEPQNQNTLRIYPVSGEWKNISYQSHSDTAKLKIDPDFYIKTRRVDRKNR